MGLLMRNTKSVTLHSEQIKNYTLNLKIFLFELEINYLT
jgi:hypothetical protein